MNYIPNVRPRAEKDIGEAALYYEQQIEGLGKDFIFCFKRRYPVACYGEFHSLVTYNYCRLCKFAEVCSIATDDKYFLLHMYEIVESNIDASWALLNTLSEWQNYWVLFFWVYWLPSL